MVQNLRTALIKTFMSSKLWRLTSNWKVNTGCFLNSFDSFPQITQKIDSSSCIGDLERNLSIGKHSFLVCTWYFGEIVGKSLFRWFIYVFVSICSISVHFQRFILLNATLWFTVTHTFMDNRRKLADWSKWICITLWGCFRGLLTTN